MQQGLAIVLALLGSTNYEAPLSPRVCACCLCVLWPSESMRRCRLPTTPQLMGSSISSVLLLRTVLFQKHSQYTAPPAHVDNFLQIVSYQEAEKPRHTICEQTTSYSNSTPLPSAQPRAPQLPTPSVSAAGLLNICPSNGSTQKLCNSTPDS